MRYITTILKYVGKALETASVIDPIIRGLLSIWRPKKKETPEDKPFKPQRG